jgi:hypothetical protein
MKSERERKKKNPEREAIGLQGDVCCSPVESETRDGMRCGFCIEWFEEGRGGVGRGEG